MGNYVQTSLEQYINESKAFTLKRKYADKPAVVVGTKAPLRTQVLNYVAENAKVSLGDLKKFIIGLNEGKARPAAASMWIKRNAQFFVMENSNGVSYFKLSNLGKKLARTGVVAPVAPVATAPTMADVTNESKVDEGCGCKKRPPIRKGQLIERFTEDPDVDGNPEDTEEDFGIGDPRYGVDRARSIDDEGMEEDIVEPETDEDYIEDDITDDEDELEDEDLEDDVDIDDDGDVDEDDEVLSEIDELRTEVEELRAIIDELTSDEDDEEIVDDEDLEDEDENLEDEEDDISDLDPEELKARGDGSFEDDADLPEDDNTEATEFEEDSEIDESTDALDDEDEDDEDVRPVRDPMKRRRPKDEEHRSFDFKDKGRPGLLDVDESVTETPEEKVRRVIENIKAKRAAKLNEATEEKAEDVGSTPPKEDATDELTDKDVSNEPEAEQDTTGGAEEAEPVEEKVEITEFVITVDDIDAAMQELEELGIQAQRVPKEAETTEEMPQEVETPEAPAEEPAADDLDLSLGNETTPAPETTPAAPVKEAATTPTEEAPAEDELDLGLGDETAAEAPAEAQAPAEAPDTLAPTTEFEENKLKVPADQWETLKPWLEGKGVDVVEMFGGEIEVEDEPGTMGADDTEEINFDDLELEDDTKVDKNEEEPEDGKAQEEAPATV